MQPSKSFMCKVRILLLPISNHFLRMFKVTNVIYFQAQTLHSDAMAAILVLLQQFQGQLILCTYVGVAHYCTYFACATSAIVRNIPTSTPFLKLKENFL